MTRPPPVPRNPFPHNTMSTAAPAPPVAGTAPLALPVVMSHPLGDFTVPATAATFRGFREWTWSDDFPEHGRIDFVDGVLHFDLLPERVRSHGLPKTELVRVIGNRVAGGDLGQVYTGRTQLSSPGPPAVCCEPDLLFVHFDSLRAGEVRHLRTPDGLDSYGLEGAADLVGEVVSPETESRDTTHLPASLFANGTREYWPVDCRDGAADLTIHTRGPAGFVAATADAHGYQTSPVLGTAYRLERTFDPLGDAEFTLHER